MYVDSSDLDSDLDTYFKVLIQTHAKAHRDFKIDR